MIVQDKVKQRIISFVLAFIITISNFTGLVKVEATTMPSKTINSDMDVNIMNYSDEDQISNPTMPKTYSMTVNTKARVGDRTIPKGQPYSVTVGDNEYEYIDKNTKEKKKLNINEGLYNKRIKLPEFEGYEKPSNSFSFTYNDIKNTKKDSIDYIYSGTNKYIEVKHVFQDPNDTTKYGHKPGNNSDIITRVYGVAGSNIQAQPLSQEKIIGYTPEQPLINTIMPIDTNNHVLEYRYNLISNYVKFDTKGGSPINGMKLYYGTTIPSINQEPTKRGYTFKGWKVNTPLRYGNNGENTLDTNKVFKFNEFPEGILNAMPEKEVVFEAVWEPLPKANYAIQFWSEMADKGGEYEPIGMRVVEDADTGSTIDLDNVSVKGVKFPDLDDKRLEKIWKGSRFNRGRDLFLGKFFVYNKELTDKENKDPKTKEIKTVSPDGTTVYNIYYDRQVYDLYFTKSNALPDSEKFYPQIWAYDPVKEEAVMVGGPGKPYHYKARFNELMYKWPNDAMQVKGFTPGWQSYGWGGNYGIPRWPWHLDTPPYRLNAEQFLDAELPESGKHKDYNSYGGYTKHIDKGDGTTIDLDKLDFKTLSFGIKQSDGEINGKPIPHHIDIWVDGFNPGEQIVRYDLYRPKADTSSSSYGHRSPIIQGFTPKESSKTMKLYTKDGIDKLNDERKKVTPLPKEMYYNTSGTKLQVGVIDFISVFFSDYDDFGDPIDGIGEFKKNGYIRFEYSRNKYPLRLNNDPRISKDYNDYSPEDVQEVFYEYPIKELNLKTPEKPSWVPENWEFKGWSLDAGGNEMVKESDYKMPTRDLVLYAQWGEPEEECTLTLDPNGGTLGRISAEDFRTYSDGDIIATSVGKKKYILPSFIKMDGNKQIFKVRKRMPLKEFIDKPVREGYEFTGWEVIRINPATGEIDKSFKEKYGVPELYTFSNEIEGNTYLKAIWISSNLVTVKGKEYFLDIKGNKLKDSQEYTLAKKRVGYHSSTFARKHGQNWLLMTKQELKNLPEGNEYKDMYKKSLERDVNFINSYFQDFITKPPVENDGDFIYNPDNIFEFYYKPYESVEYKVNYMDDRIKNIDNPSEEDIKKYTLDSEMVSTTNRDFDSRNYKKIDGWTLYSEPQVQVVIDRDSNGNVLGINGTGKYEINFYYKDSRVLKTTKDAKTPKNYHRIVFAAKDGGTLNKNGEKEIYYDVIDGLLFSKLILPEATPDSDYSFVNWADSHLLDSNTLIKRNYKFKAEFTKNVLPNPKPLKIYESIKSEDSYINNFIPTKDEIEKSIEDIMNSKYYKSYTIKDSELDLYKKFMEDNSQISDKSPRKTDINIEVELVEGTKVQIKVPVFVYKNIYRSLNNDEKPEIVESDEMLKDYKKVVVVPTIINKDSQIKTYYVNPKAKVQVPLVDIEPMFNSKFNGWTINGAEFHDERQYYKEDSIIKAEFDKKVDTTVKIKPEIGTVNTILEKPISEKDYKKAITNLPDGISVEYIRVIKDPDISKVGETEAEVEAVFSNGDVQILKVPVNVGQDPKDKTIQELNDKIQELNGKIANKDSEIQQINTQLENLKKELDSCQNKCKIDAEACQKDKDKLNSQLEDYKKKLAAKERELEELGKKVQSIEEKLNKEVNKNKQLEKELKDLKSKYQTLEESHRKAEDKIKDLEKQSKDLSKENENLKNEKGNSNKKIKELEKEINTLQEDKKKLEDEKNRIQGEKDAVERDKDRIQGEKDALEKEKDRIQGEKDAADKKIGQLEQEKAAIEKEKNKLQDEKSKLEDEKSKLQGEKSQLETDKGNLEREKGQLQTDKSELEKRIRELETKIVNLETTIREKETVIIEKERVISEKERIIQEKDRIIEDNKSNQDQCDGRVAELEKKIAEKDNLLKEAKDKIKDLENKIDNINHYTEKADEKIKELINIITKIKTESKNKDIVIEKEKEKWKVEKENLEKEIVNNYKEIYDYRGSYQDNRELKSQLEDLKNENNNLKKETDEYNKYLMSNTINKEDYVTIFKIGNSLYKTYSGGRLTTQGEMTDFEGFISPFISNDRTMIPLRYVALALGLEVEWDNTNRIAVFTNKDRDNILNPGKITISADTLEMKNQDGKLIKVDSKPILEKGRFYISITNLTKAFGGTNGITTDRIKNTIEWDPNGNRVLVYKYIK